MEVSKFIIDGNDVFVKDAQTRDSITTLSDNVTTAQNTADRAEGKADYAQTTANSAATTAQSALTAAQAAQSTADEKLNTSDAWKCGQLSKTFNDITIATGGTYDFVFDIPDGVTDAFVIYARSADMDRPLLPINIFRYGTEFHNHMYNAGSSISSATIQIQIIYMYR